MHVRQPKVPTVETKGEFGVVEAKKAQELLCGGCAVR
jgi:hypothetical protein